MLDTHVYHVRMREEAGGEAGRRREDVAAPATICMLRGTDNLVPSSFSTVVMPRFLSLLAATALLGAALPYARADDDVEEVDLDADVDSVSAEDMLGAQEAAVAGGAGGAAAEEEPQGEEGEEAAAPVEDLSAFDPIEALGADLACSACELTLDVLIKNYGLTETVIRRKLEDEAAAEEAEKEAAEKAEKGEETDEEKDEDEDEKEDAADDADDADDAADEKKKKKKKKKDKKKTKKKKKPEVKVEPKAVATAVMDMACTAADFDTVTTIGTYPGRRYDQYGGGYQKKKKKKSKKKKKKKKDAGDADADVDAASSEETAAVVEEEEEEDKNADLVRTCKKMVEGTEAWLKTKLASSSTRGSFKSLKKVKKDFCEKKNKMCKTAALGFEAESACMAKMLRHMAAGEYDKALKLSKKCPKESVVKEA